MGLDMYVSRISKVDLEYRLYTSDEINDIGLNVCTIKDFENAGLAMEQILPYASKIQTVNEYYDMEKIKADYNLPGNSHIGMISPRGIRVGGRDADGQYVSVDISPDDIRGNYTITEVEDCYAWQSEEVAYWRKNYDLRDAFYDLIGYVENCGYYVIDAEMINALQVEFEDDMCDVPAENPTSEQALFYHEWY